MFAKLLTLILAVCVVGGVLLDLRHRRLYLMHDMTRMHHVIDQDRKTIWNEQVHVAYQFSPEQLRESLTEQDLPLIPRAVEEVAIVNVNDSE